MGKKELISTNPLRVLGLDNKAEEGGQNLGLVMARAGLGKTAILVQIALDSMLRGNRVLHVAIGQSIEKTRDRYDDILVNLVSDLDEATSTDISRKRMIMTFKEQVFSRTMLEERLKDLIQQDVFKPDCLIIDGYEFDENSRQAMEELKQLMADLGISVIWFSAVRHRDDERVSADGVPAPCHTIDDLFEVVLLINPQDEVMKLDILRCAYCEVEPGTTLLLDPSTMLIKKS
jgi:thymidine kinase